MKIAGVQRTSLIDFPGFLACTVFTAGCNLRCPWCHNGSILGSVPEEELIAEADFFAFLDSRQKVLDGVVISGGEPTLQPDLKEFILKIRERGFLVKLDSNGTQPEVLQDLLCAGLLDYVAMDVKAAPRYYAEVAGVEVPRVTLARSLELIRRLAPKYEFRVTLVPGLHDEKSVAELGEFLREGPLYLQNFQAAEKAPGETFRTLRSFSGAEMVRFAEILRSRMTDEIRVRNL